jgi:flavin reductase (DIM6/NTAB) family NADH-FMN oxidoreductase RutF
VTIHTDHPFLPDPEDRDQLRRFRSRLPVPVTIVTSGTPDTRAGLTVSSLLVTEGDPGEALLLVSPNTDLWDAVEETRRLVVHVCSPEDRGLAEVFAGRQPSPGGMFAGRTVSDGPWGPVLEDLPDRLSVSVTSVDSLGWSGIVRGRVDQVDLAGSADPLVYFRGRYRTLN